MNKSTFNGEVKLYKWITKDYFEKALRNLHNDKSLIIKEFHVKPAVGKGENYAGIIDRVFAIFESKGQGKSISMILKYYFENDDFTDMAYKEYMIFDKEMNIYEKILPKLNSCITGINQSEKLFAESINVDFVSKAMILEDLSVKNYITADRIAKLDYDHAALVLRKLAYMHATSAVLEERNPGTFKEYDRGFFNKYTDTFTNFFVGNLKALTDLVDTWGPEYTYYKDKLERLQGQLMKKGLEIFTPKKEDFNCFLHGDIWTPNVMFLYDSKAKPLNAVIIDFQFSVWASPALDLLYFINTSCKNDVRFYREEELIKYYLYQLVDTLKNLNYKGNIPSLQDFFIQYEDKQFYGKALGVAFDYNLSFFSHRVCVCVACGTDSNQHPNR